MVDRIAGGEIYASRMLCPIEEGAHPRTAPEVFSLSHDEGAGEGRGEGNLFREHCETGVRKEDLPSPALPSILMEGRELGASVFRGSVKMRP